MVNNDSPLGDCLLSCDQFQFQVIRHRMFVCLANCEVTKSCVQFE